MFKTRLENYLEEQGLPEDEICYLLGEYLEKNAALYVEAMASIEEIVVVNY